MNKMNGKNKRINVIARSAQVRTSSDLRICSSPCKQGDRGDRIYPNSCVCFKLKNNLIGRSLEKIFKKIFRDDFFIFGYAKVLIIAAVLSTAIISKSWAENEVTIRDSGTCGTNCTWSLDTEGVFTLSGSGSMTDYDWLCCYNGDYGYLNSSKEPYPWYNYLSDIKSIKKAEGSTISNVAYGAFRGANNLESVELPGVTYIHRDAFRETGVKDVYLPDVTYIRSNAFYGDNNIERLYLPNFNRTDESDWFTNVKPQNLTMSNNGLYKYLVGGGKIASDTNITCSSGDCMDILTTWDANRGTHYASDVTISCAEGYLTKGGGCSKPEDCTGEYIVDSVNGACIKMPGCVDYADGACGSCEKGFYKKENGCVSSTEGCGGTYLEKDGVCISASQGCGAGYKDMGGFCNRIQYTPAEAAKVLHDDNTNTVTITFKK